MNLKSVSIAYCFRLLTLRFIDHLPCDAIQIVFSLHLQFKIRLELKLIYIQQRSQHRVKPTLEINLCASKIYGLVPETVVLQIGKVQTKSKLSIFPSAYF